MHNGHIEIALAIARNFKLDRLLVVPANRPPHKDPRSLSNTYHRYAMAVLALLDQPSAVVSTVEIEAPDKPYTFETIARLRELHDEGDGFYFIMGADSFEEIMTWRRPEAILEGANVVVAARPGHGVATSHLPEHLASRVRDLRGAAGPIEAAARSGEIFLTDYVVKDISSTEIRRVAREGGDVSDMVPPPVATYIKRYGVYRR